MNTARVTEEHKTSYIIHDGKNELTATVRGAFFTTDTFPKVGDNVVYTKVEDKKAVIEEILPRTSSIVRKSAGTDTPQVLVANVDLMFIVMGLDNDFNLSRLERYLLLAKQSLVDAVVVLNKCDEVVDSARYSASVKTVARETPVHTVSALTGASMETLLPYLTPNTTVVLLGSSGAGKSTITNWLLDENKQKVSAVRGDDDRGRHTTTSRQMFTLPSGAYLIDTPGIRELSLVGGAESDEEELFSKIEELTKQCKFSKCDHEKTKGCAVLEAVKDGDISERQLRNYLKLQKERLFAESRMKEDFSFQYRQKQKKLHKGYKKILKQKKSESDFEL